MNIAGAGAGVEVIGAVTGVECDCAGAGFELPVVTRLAGDSDIAGTSLGIQAVSDRIAQTVVQRYLEPILEPVFHKDSYGYRPGRSAHDALAVARQRCWRYDWVLDLDIKSFFGAPG